MQTHIADAHAAHNTNALIAIGDHVGSRLKKVMGTYVLAQTVWGLTKQMRAHARQTFAHTVAVDSRDDIYVDVQVALLHLIPEKKRRALVVAGKRQHEYAESVGGFKSHTELGLYYDGKREQKLILEGHHVRVQIEKEDITDSKSDGPLLRPERLVFTARTIEGRDAVVRFLRSVIARNDSRESSRFFMAERYGSWRRREDIEPRALDTVILRDGQKEALVQDITEFLSLRDRYMKFGIPYHRGYLFHGPPGTGKTSLAKALANHFDLDIYYVPISDLEKDTSLLQLVAGVEPGSVLLLEDVDVLHAARERNDDEQGVTLSGLLNALDGVSTPSGLITILTTNFREVLDDALLRPGRVDRDEEITWMDDDQLERLVEQFVGQRVRLPRLKDRKLAPADVMEVIKRHLLQPDVALQRLREFLKT